MDLSFPHGHRHLLGLHWNNRLYVDQVLSFRLCSAPLNTRSLTRSLHFNFEQSLADDFKEQSKGFLELQVTLILEQR